MTTEELYDIIELQKNKISTLENQVDTLLSITSEQQQQKESGSIIQMAKKNKSLVVKINKLNGQNFQLQEKIARLEKKLKITQNYQHYSTTIEDKDDPTPRKSKKEDDEFAQFTKMNDVIVEEYKQKFQKSNSRNVKLQRDLEKSRNLVKRLKKLMEEEIQLKRGLSSTRSTKSEASSSLRSTGRSTRMETLEDLWDTVKETHKKQENSMKTRIKLLKQQLKKYMKMNTLNETMNGTMNGTRDDISSTIVSDLDSDVSERAKETLRTLRTTKQNEYEALRTKYDALLSKAKKTSQKSKARQSRILVLERTTQQQKMKLDRLLKKSINDHRLIELLQEKAKEVNKTLSKARTNLEKSKRKIDSKNRKINELKSIKLGGTMNLTQGSSGLGSTISSVTSNNTNASISESTISSSSEYSSALKEEMDSLKEETARQKLQLMKRDKVIDDLKQKIERISKLQLKEIEKSRRLPSIDSKENVKKLSQKETQNLKNELKLGIVEFEVGKYKDILKFLRKDKDHLQEEVEKTSQQLIQEKRKTSELEKKLDKLSKKGNSGTTDKMNKSVDNFLMEDYEKLTEKIGFIEDENLALSKILETVKESKKREIATYQKLLKEEKKRINQYIKKNSLVKAAQEKEKNSKKMVGADLTDLFNKVKTLSKENMELKLKNEELIFRLNSGGLNSNEF